MASNLPGFLRRTLRSSFDDEYDEAAENGSSDNEKQQQHVTEDTSGSSANDTASPRDNNNDNHQKGSSNDRKVPESSREALEENGDHVAVSDSVTKEPIQDAAVSDRSSRYSHFSSSKSMASSDFSSSNALKPATTHQAPRQKTYREVQFDKVMSASVVNMEELRKLSWNGVPNSYRALAWKILLGYMPTNSARRQTSLQRKRSEYRDAIAQHYDIDDDSRTQQEQETLRQVLVDVPRTAPEVPLFRNDRIRRTLSRLLYIWAMRHPASSYVQGINDLATPLLVVFLSDYYDGEDVLDGHVMNQLSDEQLQELEADVYGCLTNLLAGIQDHYTSDQPGVQRMVLRLEELVNRIDGDLCEHLRETGIEFIQFAFKWMNCLLLREFQLSSVVRLWDTYISESNGFEVFHVYVCAAFLCQFSARLQSMGFDELFGFMQAMPTEEWGDTEIEMLLSQAYVLSTLFQNSDAHLTSTNPRNSSTSA